MNDKDVKLIMKFDADQVTKSLEYDFIDSAGVSIFHKSGRCANTFKFPCGGKMYIELIGKAQERDKMQFSVVDFTLTSVSTLGPAQSPLSLFNPRSACVSISDWGEPAIVEDAATGTTITTVRANTALPLVSDDAQWDMSGFLSVEIEMTNKDGKREILSRLFYFDPESTAGSGGNISI